MGPEEHLDALVRTLPQASIDAYKKCQNTRLEVCYRGRVLVVYQSDGRKPHVLGRFTVSDFQADDVEGATCQMLSTEFGDMVLGYAPQRIGELDLFLFLPLHAKVRWSAPASKVTRGSLGFPVVIRTLSRIGLRRPDVTYCETAYGFSAEFSREA